MFARCALFFTIIGLAILISPTLAGVSHSKGKGKVSSGQETDQLVQIQRKDLRKLQNLYTPDGTKNYIAYMTISNYIRWLEQNPKLNDVKFYSLNGNFSDGTFLVTDGYAASVDTFNESYDRLYRLLKLVDYSKNYFFMSIRTEIKPIFKRALEEVNIEITLDEPALLYYLPKNNALKFNIQVPEGIELRQIRDSRDMEKVIAAYPHPRQNLQSYVEKLGKYNPQIGAFKKDDGTMVAWEFIYPSGLLGVLQTDPLYYGKGYAALITKYLSKQLAEMGFDVYTLIDEVNTPSRKLFGKLGFKSIGEIHWIDTKVMYK
ncbi:uncharacterized protein LOC116343273 [Contarinia nasturtii]|uniref:uncharacterized protein LOC116343273 n=1 Tax=Contarinia nasturtii TaxID=265458 RepID=UPI0012D446E8|nr:uncharacterized protein LOC116343273 [Contarinia nasturtii]